MNEAAVISKAEVGGKSTALVSFYLGDAETLIFWIDNRSPAVKVARAQVGQAEIEAAAARLRSLFSRERINYSRPEHTTDMIWLNSLGDKLLTPLKDWLETCEELIIAPHGDLHSLPLHILSLKGGPPLGTTHAITYVANLSLYALLLSRQHGRVTFQLPSLCLATAAREDSESIREGFTMTPRSYAEKTGGVLLQGLQATWPAFIRHAESSASIYLSCHGCFNEQDSLQSALLLSDGQSLPTRIERNGASHELSVRDILELRIRSRLVILDACVSGVQHISPGDEPMGFSTAFLLSGADAVIASSWVVEQNCARFFMLKLQEFWSETSVTLGQAMQQAYKVTRSRHPHPFHWAAFSLIGNNRLLFR